MLKGNKARGVGPHPYRPNEKHPRSPASIASDGFTRACKVESQVSRSGPQQGCKPRGYSFSGHAAPDENRPCLAAQGQFNNDRMDGEGTYHFSDGSGPWLVSHAPREKVILKMNELSKNQKCWWKECLWLSSLSVRPICLHTRSHGKQSIGSQ